MSTLKDKYPRMYKNPWDGILELPPQMWADLRHPTDNYMVESNHEVVQVIRSNFPIPAELDHKNWVIIPKKIVNTIIKQFKEEFET